MSIEVSQSDITEDAIYQASLIPVQNTTNTVIKRKRKNSVSKVDKKPRKTYTKKKKSPIEYDVMDLINTANNRHEDKILHPLNEDEISKDANVTFSRMGNKVDKLLGFSDKKHLLKMSKIISYFKSSFPCPAIFNEQKNEINHFIKENIQDNFHDTISNNILLKDSLNNQSIVEKPKRVHQSSKTQKITFDNKSQVYELSTNEVMKIPSNVCGLNIHGFIINHGLEDQVMDSLWLNHKDRSFYVVSKLIKMDNDPLSFLDKLEDQKLSTFNINSKSKQLEGHVEIWELRKDIGLILIKTYKHNLGIFKDMQLIHGTYESFDNEASKNNIRFLLSSYCTTEAVQVFQLDTSPTTNPTNDLILNNSILKIKLNNDIISCYSLIQKCNQKNDHESLKVCIGSVNGKLYLYDLNLSVETPLKVFKVSESMITSIKSALNSSTVCCTTMGGQVFIVELSAVHSNANLLSKTIWVSPPIVEYIDHPKAFLFTDGTNSLFYSPLNMLDLKSICATRQSRISCLGISQQHAFALMGTLSGEVSIENMSMRILVSRKNFKFSELVKLFEWNYDEVKKIYQLDPTRKIERAHDGAVKLETGLKYQGCGIMNTRWIECNSGERYFSFMNNAGLSVVTKID
ncbi:uncharacterized protein HGUI_02029 [Hanseniaspora guilliermondii]|uniref:Transcription factor tau 91 kDa subunit n=1 Tax=Hanseniaspora guilliermondii TaxID=56406 RepID=A0A1L0CLU1_9ASCO|nr:uncharacterized protein HGUI_02029 [Hanseniaspora guilliermondii]